MKSKVLLASLALIAVTAGGLIILDRTLERRIVVDFRGAPQLGAVAGFYEVDGVRHSLTNMPFRLDTRAHRVLFQFEPTGGGFTSSPVFVEIYSGENTASPVPKQTVALASSPLETGIKGWVQHGLFGRRGAYAQKFDPKNDAGWKVAPP